MPITRLPLAAVTRPARKPAGVGLTGGIGSPIGGVAGGEIGTGWIRPVEGSSRSSPAVPRITILPSLPTAIASGREPIKYSFSACWDARLMRLIVDEPTLATYNVLPSGLIARLAG